MSFSSLHTALPPTAPLSSSMVTACFFHWYTLCTKQRKVTTLRAFRCDKAAPSLGSQRRPVLYGCLFVAAFHLFIPSSSTASRTATTASQHRATSLLGSNFDFTLRHPAHVTQKDPLGNDPFLFTGSTIKHVSEDRSTEITQITSDNVHEFLIRKRNFSPFWVCAWRLNQCLC